MIGTSWTITMQALAEAVQTSRPIAGAAIGQVCEVLPLPQREKVLRIDFERQSGKGKIAEVGERLAAGSFTALAVQCTALELDDPGPDLIRHRLPAKLAEQLFDSGNPPPPLIATRVFELDPNEKRSSVGKEKINFYLAQDTLIILHSGNCPLFGKAMSEVARAASGNSTPCRSPTEVMCKVLGSIARHNEGVVSKLASNAQNASVDLLHVDLDAAALVDQVRDLKALTYMKLILRQVSSQLLRAEQSRTQTEDEFLQRQNDISKDLSNTCQDAVEAFDRTINLRTMLAASRDANIQRKSQVWSTVLTPLALGMGGAALGSQVLQFPGWGSLAAGVICSLIAVAYSVKKKWFS